MNQILKCLKNVELSYNDVSKWDINDVKYKKFDNKLLNIVHLYYYYEQDEKLNNILYITIRGSACIYDILNDIDIHQVLFKELKKEESKKELEELKEELKEKLKEELKKKEELKEELKELHANGKSSSSSIPTVNDGTTKTLSNLLKKKEANDLKEILHVDGFCPSSSKSQLLKEELKKKEELKSKLYVHYGFYTDFCKIKNFVTDLINSKIVNKIYFAGHSRGAAIATITALYIRSLFNNIKVYNIGFGCPKIGCRHFVTYYNKLLSSTTYLIRTQYDIIPQLPVHNYYDTLHQYIIENRKLILYNPIDSFNSILHSKLDYHKLMYYKQCDYDFIHRKINNFSRKLYKLYIE